MFNLGMHFMKAMIFVLLMSLYSIAEIPEFEPTRMWEGKSYADAVVEYFRKNNPGIDVTIDLNDLIDFAGERKQHTLESIRAEVNGAQAERLNTSSFQQITLLGRHLLPSAITNLTWSLEAGNYIYSSEPQVDRKAKETVFLDWILAQPDFSIEPHILMSEALKINQGRLFAAWTMAWNVLNKNWSAAAVRNYGTVTRKMISLTGERSLWQSSVHAVVLTDAERKVRADVTIERGNGTEFEKIKDQDRYIRLAITKRGDEFSYLYHRIGVELLSMVAAEYFKSNTIGSLLAKSGAVAEWLKYIKTSGVQGERIKRVTNDLIAGTSGARIYHLFKTKKSSQFQNQKHFSAANYLSKNQMLYGGKYALDQGRPSVYLGVSNLNPKYWDNYMTLEELKFRFHYGTRFDSDALNMVLLLANGDYDLIHRGLVAYMNSSTIDVELNTYLKDHFEGIKATPNPKDISVDLNLSDDLNLVFMKQAWEGYDLNRAQEYWQRLLQKVLLSKGVYNSYPLESSRNGYCKRFYN